MNIDSIENKRFLWTLMQENGLFNGIENNKFNDIQTLFERKLSEVKRENPNVVDESNMLSLNKKIIGDMVEELKNIKKEKKAVKVYKAEEIQQQRQIEFDKKLKIQQESFNNTINAEKPKNIDFSDKEDTPFGGEMDGIIAQTLASRERELEQMTQYNNTSEAKKWIGTENVVIQDNLKIGETAPLHDVKEIIKNPPTNTKVAKRVTFEDTKIHESSNTIDFLSKIKTKPKSDNTEEFNELKNEVREIKEMQGNIMVVLSLIQTKLDQNQLITK